MKLYTEEQVIEMLGYDKSIHTTILRTILQRHKPIELPIDDEVRKYAINLEKYNDYMSDYEADIAYAKYYAAIDAAKWVIEYIKQQAK